MSEPENKKVLLIEDDNDHAEIIQYYINEHSSDIDIMQLKDGKQAIDYIQGDLTENSYPWLILLDLKLPKFSGHEIITRFKSDKRLSEIPLVVFTTSVSEEDINKALSAGANSYLQKPIKVELFEKVITSIIDYWSMNKHSLVFNKLNKYDE